MFIGGYWAAREDPPTAAAALLSQFLEFLATQRDDLRTWFFKGRSKRDALRRRLASFEPATIVRHLEFNRTDTDHTVVLDLGTSFSVWNGDDIEFSAHLGCYSKYVGNNVVLSFGEASPEPTLQQQRTILEALIRIFDPAHAVATSNAVLDEARAELPWVAGWLKYERGGPVRECSR